VCVQKLGCEPVSALTDAEAAAMEFVAPGTSRSGRAVRERDDPRVLDAADLRELLWYAVDRETRQDLCGTHLGGPPGHTRPGRRGRETLGGATGRWSGTGGRPQLERVGTAERPGDRRAVPNEPQ
jgi:hypothetical protein